MQIIPILDDTCRSAAVQLLVEGFGKHAKQWQEAFKAPAFEQFGHGYLLKEDNDFQGVVLLFQHLRFLGEQRVPFVNISSWFIREKYRSLAPLMLAVVTRNKNTVYTDFTPTRDVGAILRALRFRQIAHGSTVILPIPSLLQLPKRSISVSLDIDFSGDPTEELLGLAQHREKGFIVGRLSRDGEHVPFAFYPIRKRGWLFPLLVYCARPELMVDALPMVFRRLVWRYGATGLLVPRRDGYERVRGFVRPSAFPMYVRGPVPDSKVDHLYSEFLYLREIIG